jgi:MFS family permease
VNYRRLSRFRAKYEEEAKVEQNESQATYFPFEAARLQVAAPFMLLIAFAFVAYGWALQIKLPLAISLLIQALIGLCANSLLGIIYVLLVDLFPEQAAATSGAADLVRCCLGALSAAIVDKMLSTMGWNWCFSFIGLIMVVSLPLIGVVYFYGPRWREERNVKINPLFS